MTPAISYFNSEQNHTAPWTRPGRPHMFAINCDLVPHVVTPRDSLLEMNGFQQDFVQWMSERGWWNDHCVQSALHSTLADVEQSSTALSWVFIYFDRSEDATLFGATWR